MGQVVTAELQDLAQAITDASSSPTGQRTARFIFWLGAGASASAGIPLAEGMVDRLLDRWWRHSQSPSGTTAQVPPYARLTRKEAKERQTQIRAWARQNKSLDVPKDFSDWGTLYTKCLSGLRDPVARQEFIIECIDEGRGRLNLAHQLAAQLMAGGLSEPF